MSEHIRSGLAERVYMGCPWPPGPWDSEPDRVQWRDEATGLDCLALREKCGRGFWCGYVAVPAGHALFGKGYNETPIAIDVHGGLTYSNECSGTPDAGICHVSDDGDHAWWFGFDCAHCFDRSPGDEVLSMQRGYPFMRGPNEVYRTLAYVRDECRKLAAQLAELS